MIGAIGSNSAHVPAGAETLGNLEEHTDGAVGLGPLSARDVDK